MRKRNENAVDELRKKKILMNVIYQIPIKWKRRMKSESSRHNERNGFIMRNLSPAFWLFPSPGRPVDSINKYRIQNDDYHYLLLLFLLAEHASTCVRPTNPISTKNIIDLKSKRRNWCVFEVFDSNDYNNNGVFNVCTTYHTRTFQRNELSRMYFRSTRVVVAVLLC